MGDENKERQHLIRYQSLHLAKILIRMWLNLVVIKHPQIVKIVNLAY